MVQSPFIDVLDLEVLTKGSDTYIHFSSFSEKTKQKEKKKSMKNIIVNDYLPIFININSN